jgi:hypothetical protein
MLLESMGLVRRSHLAAHLHVIEKHFLSLLFDQVSSLRASGSAV